MWEVYDNLRTARLNIYYWTEKLDKPKHQNRSLEIFLAIAVPSSAVAGLSFWQSYYGPYVWGFLSSIAAFLSVAKPFLKLTERVESYEAAVARYRTIEGDLSELRTDIMQERAYDNQGSIWIPGSYVSNSSSKAPNNALPRRLT